MSRRLVDGKRPKPKKKKAIVAQYEGRPTDLTLELKDKICAVVRMGSHVDIAFAVNGVKIHTARHWIILGQSDPNSLYGELFNGIHKAIAEFEVKSLHTLHQAANGSPAEFLMQPVKNSKGDVILMSNGQPLMEPVKDAEGNPIQTRAEIKADPRITQWFLERRSHRRWGAKVNIMVDNDEILNAKPETGVSEQNAVKAEDHQKLIDRVTKMVAERIEMGDMDDA